MEWIHREVLFMLLDDMESTLLLHEGLVRPEARPGPPTGGSPTEQDLVRVLEELEDRGLVTRHEEPTIDSDTIPELRLGRGTTAWWRLTDSGRALARREGDAAV